MCPSPSYVPVLGSGRPASFSTLAATTAALGETVPASHGAAAWAFDPALAVNTTLLTNGTVYFTKLPVAADVSLTRLYWWVSVAAATATAGQNEVGLYSAAGTRLCSVNVDADITSAGIKTTTLPATAVAGGAFVWAAMVFNAATAPTIARAAGNATTPAAVNFGLGPEAYRFAVAGTAQTVLPASITPSALTQGPFAGPWAATG